MNHEEYTAKFEDFSELVKILESKAAANDKPIGLINQCYLSNKTYSVCGEINKMLTLQDCEWTCGSCKTSHDRDKNAAVST